MINISNHSIIFRAMRCFRLCALLHLLSIINMLGVRVSKQKALKNWHTPNHFSKRPKPRGIKATYSE